MVSARDVVAAVPDPELRVVTIEELGILRDVAVEGGTVTVTITPTYSGCPAMDTIRADIRAALHGAGHDRVEVRTVLSPAWTTDWISQAGRSKLAAAGIAPPGPSSLIAAGLASLAPRASP
jgi:ring-1,2-phenylacetyl-CoA epoxidase subunit PaaD